MISTDLKMTLNHRVSKRLNWEKNIIPDISEHFPLQNSLSGKRAGNSHLFHKQVHAL